MRIIKNQSIIDTMSQNLIKNELSNIAAVLAVPQIPVIYYSIDAEYSQTLNGYKNVHDFISASSTVAFNRINNLPIAGIDNLLMTNEFNDETGMDVDYESEGMILPRTINPKPNDFFIIPGMSHPTLFAVTEVRQTVVRSNPFIAIRFKLAHQGQEWIDQIERQVLKRLTFTVGTLGADKSLIIEESLKDNIEEHIQNYLDVSSMYVDLFYNRSKACFIYEWVTSNDACGDTRASFIDMVLWRIMYDFGIIVYDDIRTYANDNYNMRYDKIFIDSPRLVSDFKYKNSILYRILENNHSKSFAEYQYPMWYNESWQITKYHGPRVSYIEGYDKICSGDTNFGDIVPFESDFICRIVNNAKYDNSVSDYTLKNAIISYYNEEDIDFSSIELRDVKTLNNYYLIPILLGIYKNYITSLTTEDKRSNISSNLYKPMEGVK